MKALESGGIIVRFLKEFVHLFIFDVSTGPDFDYHPFSLFGFIFLVPFFCF